MTSPIAHLASPTRLPPPRVAGAHVHALIADEHPVFRAGLRAFLASVEDVDIVVEAPSSLDVHLALAGAPLELATVDISLRPSGGATAVRALRERMPGCAILGLSGIEEPIRIAELLRAGADGYALKDQPPAELRVAIATVLAGQRYLAPTLPIDEIDRLVSAEALPLDRLTSRERHVFALLVRGHTNAKTAAALGIAASTVEAHRRHIMHKLEARSIVDLVRLAQRHGVLSRPKTYDPQ